MREASIYECCDQAIREVYAARDNGALAGVEEPILGGKVAPTGTGKPEARKSKLSDAQVIWSNRQWAVTDDASLEAEEFSYYVDGRRFFAKRGHELALEPILMAEKKWVDLDALFEAAMHLSRHFGIKPGYDTEDIFRKARMWAAKENGASPGTANAL